MRINNTVILFVGLFLLLFSYGCEKPGSEEKTAPQQAPAEVQVEVTEQASIEEEAAEVIEEAAADMEEGAGEVDEEMVEITAEEEQSDDTIDDDIPAEEEPVEMNEGAESEHGEQQQQE